MSLLNRKIFLVLFFILFTGFSYAQCAMCRAVLETEEGGNKAEALNNGIVYLMALPYVMVGVVGYVIYRIKFKSKN